MKSFSESYKEAGVDITAGDKAVELMKKHIARTMANGAEQIGGFGGLFPLDLTGYTHPVLVSGTDGVGTKLKIAFLTGKNDTVGIDCVAMCVNDVICCGAKPLFFLDYIACGKNYPEKIADIVAGVAEGCVQSGCALIGGETAEMPGFYPVDEYDLAGFAVGIVDRDKVIDKSKMKAGDVMIALPSSGVHSNGFSLVRKIFDVENTDLTVGYPELGGKSLGEALLAPTVIYVKPLFTSNPCSRFSTKCKSRACRTSPAAAFTKICPVPFRKGWASRSKKRTFASCPSSNCCKQKAAYPIAICSTPSTWASA